MQGTVPTIDSENRDFFIFLPAFTRACEWRLVVLRAGRRSQGLVIALSIILVTERKTTGVCG
jgi:hypothetical protein